jgi:hypothetical protein
VRRERYVSNVDTLMRLLLTEAFIDESMSLPVDVIKKELKKHFNIEMPTLEEIQNSKDLQAKILWVMNYELVQNIYIDEGELVFGI